MNRSASAVARGRQRGVGLIEILVAILLMSIGFLAAARMQVQGMRISQESYNRSQAYFLAADMIDRMRSNVRGVLDGEYDDFNTAASMSDPGCAAKSCTAAQAAEQDRYDWSAKLYPTESDAPFVAALPSSTATTARGSIREKGAGSGIYAVTLFWSETHDGEEQEESLSMNFATEIPQ